MAIYNDGFLEGVAGICLKILRRALRWLQLLGSVGCWGVVFSNMPWLEQGFALLLQAWEYRVFPGEPPIQAVH